MNAKAIAAPARPPHHRTTIGQLQRAQTRARIIECAIAVFAEHGPDTPVIDDFMKAAGIARGTFYNYFQTTRELLQATMETLSDELIESIVPVVQDMPDPVMRLATAARIYYRKATTDPLFGAFLSSVSSVGTLASEHMRADLEEALQAGLIDVPDVELAHAVATGVMVFALQSPQAREGGDARALDVVRAILSGLGASKSLINKALKVVLPEQIESPRSAGPVVDPG